MREFFHSLRFKVFLGIIVALLGLMLWASTSDSATFPSSVIGAITTPIQSVASRITGFFTGKESNAGKLQKENEELKQQLRDTTEKLVDYDKIKSENDRYKDYLGIKEQNPDFEFEPAVVVSRDPNDRFYSFTIDKGSVHGIELKDPVMTADGLVGFVSELGPTYAKVLTILDVSTNVGATDSHTSDAGVLNGTALLAKEGLCRLSYLRRDCQVAVGDLIITSGTGGFYPSRLVVGTVKELKPDEQGVSLNAIIEPKADIRALTSVFVIKTFTVHLEGEEAASE